MLSTERMNDEPLNDNTDKDPSGALFLFSDSTTLTLVKSSPQTQTINHKLRQCSRLGSQMPLVELCVRPCGIPEAGSSGEMCSREAGKIHSVAGPHEDHVENGQ